ncbi:hypothetical protein LXA43DRAFT_947810 [Ganoderma leucocontextum]|nr:hypothetical protein LXA43DRAFT_947810 [Ganoderma leucocontextum]
MLPANDQRMVTFAMLPYEILQQIFNFVAAEPTYQFDPSIQRPGAHSPWLQLVRTRKALPLICRKSFWPGMSVLYRDIVFRRMGQVSALAETLRTSDIGPRLGKLTKSIRWDSCVVAAPCADVIREDLAFISGQCTQVQSFSYHPHPNFPLRCQTPDRDECDGFFNPLWFIMMPPSLSDPPLLQTSAVSNLRFLDIPVDLRSADNAMLVAIHRILPTLKALESLALGRWPSDRLWRCPEELMNMPKVSLPSLTGMRIFAPGGAVDTYICSRWDAPQLTRLTILLSPESSPTRLLETFGRRLRYLHLYPTENVSATIPPSAYHPALEDCQCSTLSAVCPRLEHLVIPKLLNTISYPLLIDSPTLVHLDLWASPKDQPSESAHRQPEDQWHHRDAALATYRHIAVKPESNVPSLRTVRFLLTSHENGLLSDFKSPTRHPDWPWICHPRLLPEGSDDVLYHRFPQGWVAQTVAAIVPQELRELSWAWEGRGFCEDWPGESTDLQDEDEHGHLREEQSSQEGDEDDEEEDNEEEDDEDDDYEHDEDDDYEDEEDEDDDEDRDDGDDMEAGEAPEKQGGREEVTGKQLEPAAELVSPEYPVAQLDRATVLAAFRRGRDRESYNHVNL